MPPASTFLPFRELPTELRLKIWSHAVLPRKILLTRVDKPPTEYFGSSAALLAVNKESREIFLQQQTCILPSRLGGHGVYVNLSTDHLQIRKEFVERGLDILLKQHLSELLQLKDISYALWHYEDGRTEWSYLRLQAVKPIDFLKTPSTGDDDDKKVLAGKKPSLRYQFDTHSFIEWESISDLMRYDPDTSYPDTSYESEDIDAKVLVYLPEQNNLPTRGKLLDVLMYATDSPYPQDSFPIPNDVPWIVTESRTQYWGFCVLDNLPRDT